jgi:hypothetical protein
MARGGTKLLIGLLLAAILAVDAAVCAMIAGEQVFLQWPDVRVKLWLALALSQIALVAIWAGLGSSFAALRIPVLIGAAIGWATLLYWPHNSTRYLGAFNFYLAESLWTIRLLCQAFVIYLPLGVARIWGLRLARRGDAASPTVPLRRFQFSIANLLAWTTGVAVMLGLSRYLFELIRQCADLSPKAIPWMLIGELCLGQAAIGLAVLWAALGTGRRGWRAAVLVAAFLVAILLHAPWATLSTASLPDYSQLCLLEAILLFAPLWVFRIAGYRLVRS